MGILPLMHASMLKAIPEELYHLLDALLWLQKVISGTIFIFICFFTEIPNLHNDTLSPKFQIYTVILRRI